MATKIDSVNRLQKYFQGVVDRADCHAPSVAELIYRLLGAVIYLKDENSHIEVRGNHEDKTGNILWVYIKGQRYTFRYEHENGGSIEIRKESYNGDILLTMTNQTNLQEVFDIFE